MQAALREHGHVLEERYADFKDSVECGYCGTLPGVLEPEEKKKKYRCENCDKLIDIGGDLLKANKKENKIILKTDKLAPFHEMVRVLEENDEGFGYLTAYKSGFPIMPLPYTAPFKNENELCDFEDIAQKAEGDKKLAMFKADIDNLGYIFSSAWGENGVSFSRYAQLSRQLHYFFSAFISYYINKHYKDTIYTVFSGGDDLCVVGAWDAVMRFASDFRKEFSKFTNNNPSVTLSGGIALFSPGLPVRSARAMAEEALDEAKDRKENDEPVKNGISVFGVTVSWEDYENSLKDAKEIIDKKVSSAVVYKMIDFAKRAGRVRNGSTSEKDMNWMRDLRDDLWKSNFWYNITRNIKFDDKKELKKVIEFFKKFGKSPEEMEKSRIAVSYALYSNR